MSETLEKLPMAKIETMLENSAVILRSTATGLECIVDDSELYVRHALQDYILDIKNVLAKLENADAELQRMQGEIK